jgi:chemotaxis protein CheD
MMHQAITHNDSAERRIHLIQGQFQVSSEPDVVLTTTLGSCVSACLCDRQAGVGGMNHFLLPEEVGSEGGEALRYGAYAMEVLVNNVLRAGGRRGHIEAKLFGGARLTDHMTDIGANNVSFAESFLRREGIRYLGGSVGGGRARRVQYWPASGRARQLLLQRSVSSANELERNRSAPGADDGAIDWFEG